MVMMTDEIGEITFKIENGMVIAEGVTPDGRGIRTQLPKASEERTMILLHLVAILEILTKLEKKDEN
jgi:hypothetical protein